MYVSVSAPRSRYPPGENSIPAAAAGYHELRTTTTAVSVAPANRFRFVDSWEGDGRPTGLASYEDKHVPS
jgi:hypothetical protein